MDTLERQLKELRLQCQQLKDENHEMLTKHTFQSFQFRNEILALRMQSNHYRLRLLDLLIAVRNNDNIITESDILGTNYTEIDYCCAYLTRDHHVRIYFITQSTLNEFEILKTQYETDNNHVTDKETMWLIGSEKFLQVKCRNLTIAHLQKKFVHYFHGATLTYMSNGAEIVFSSENEIRQMYLDNRGNYAACLEYLHISSADDAVDRCYTPKCMYRQRITSMIMQTMAALTPM